MKNIIDIEKLMQNKINRIIIAPIKKELFDIKFFELWYFLKQNIIALSIEEKELILYDYHLIKVWYYPLKPGFINYQHISLTENFYVIESQQESEIYSFPSMERLYTTDIFKLDAIWTVTTISGNNLLSYIKLDSKNNRNFFDQQNVHDSQIGIGLIDPINKKIIKIYSLPEKEFGKDLSENEYFYCTPYHFGDYIICFIENTSDASKSGYAYWDFYTGQFKGFIKYDYIDYYSVKFQEPSFLILSNNIIDLSKNTVVQKLKPEKSNCFLGFYEQFYFLTYEDQFAKSEINELVIQGPSTRLEIKLSKSIKLFTFDQSKSYYLDKDFMCILELNDLFIELLKENNLIKK